MSSCTGAYQLPLKGWFSIPYSAHCVRTWVIFACRWPEQDVRAVYWSSSWCWSCLQMSVHRYTSTTYCLHKFPLLFSFTFRAALLYTISILEYYFVGWMNKHSLQNVAVTSLSGSGLCTAALPTSNHSISALFWLNQYFPLNHQYFHPKSVEITDTVGSTGTVYSCSIKWSCKLTVHAVLLLFLFLSFFMHHSSPIKSSPSLKIWNLIVHSPLHPPPSHLRILHRPGILITPFHLATTNLTRNICMAQTLRRQRR